VQKLDDERELLRMLPGRAPRENPTALEHAAAELLAAPAQDVVRRIEKRCIQEAGMQGVIDRKLRRSFGQKVGDE
jgi:hypothetical protein